MATSGSARAATTPRRSSTSIPRSPRRSRTRSTRRWRSIATSSSRSSTRTTPRRRCPKRRSRLRPNGRLAAPAAAMSDESLDTALQRAYRYLGHRDRTVAELRRYLLGKDVAEDLADAAIEELIGQGYVD